MQSQPLGRVLIIAGSDSGGGAGIQADIKTVTALGGYAATAITALTVQNTLGVTGVHAAPLAIVEAQARAVLEDIGADAIKTGMLGDAATVELVAKLIADAGVPAVIDPVMVAKGGASLLVADAVAAVREQLVPRAALLTPNAPEAEALTGLTVATTDDLRRAGEALLAAGAKAVLMKGGHVPGDRVVDLLMTPEGEAAFETDRIETRHTHGTGCTLASACAAGLAQGLPLTDAVARAWAYVQEAMLRAPGLGAGHGPLDHGLASAGPRVRHADELEAILRRSQPLMYVLAKARELDLPDWMIFSGAVYQRALNHLTGRDLDYGIKDYDLGYYDAGDTSYEAEDVVIKRVAAAFEPPLRDLVEVRNQARVHIWFAPKFDEAFSQLSCTAEAMERFVAPLFAVGVRLEADDSLTIAAPFGLDDLFDLRLRPNPRRPTDAFPRVAGRLRERWPELRIEP